MADNQVQNTKENDTQAARHKKADKALWLIVSGIGVIILAIGLSFLITNEEADEPTFEQEEITTSLDNRECTAEQAAFLVEEANGQAFSEQKALQYEQATNCYAQLGDFITAQETAMQAEQVYTELGLDIQAEQMRNAATAYRRYLDTVEGVAPEGSSIDEGGNAL